MGPIQIFKVDSTTKLYTTIITGWPANGPVEIKFAQVDLPRSGYSTMHSPGHWYWPTLSLYIYIVVCLLLQLSNVRGLAKYLTLDRSITVWECIGGGSGGATRLKPPQYF